jgi:hypothetical protein
VLTFGKRSWGPFNGCADNGYPVPADDLTFGTFVDDVDRMLDHLGQRADIDRTVLIGHRKGSTIAATLAGTATWTPSCLSPPRAADRRGACHHGRASRRPGRGRRPRTFWVSWIDASHAAPERLEAGSGPVLVLGGTSTTRQRSRRQMSAAPSTSRSS